jgi:hypothetical protein
VYIAGQVACFAELHLNIYFSRKIMLLSTINLDCPNFKKGDAVAQLVEALRYKPVGRGFISGW